MKLQRLYRTLALQGKVSVGRRFHVGPGSRVWSHSGLRIGNDVYIGKWCTIECDGEIGDGVLIANSVGIVGRDDHDVRQLGVLARNSPWIGDETFNRQGKRLSVAIEQDVWIGFGAVILTGVRIGRGAIVAAGTVVVKDVPPYQIVAGNPNRVIGSRFSEEEIDLHEALLAKES